MKPERWQRIEQLYHKALELDAQERIAFLVQACPDDPALRREIEALLAANDRADGFLAAPALELEAQHLVADLPTLHQPPDPLSSPVQSLDGRFVSGTLLATRYRIVALIGKGGMGEVYKADDLKLDQTVALKFLPESIALDPKALARFHNEARIARQVAHPNVCRVYDIGEVEGRHFLSMEFIDGEDLSSLLRRIGRLPGDKAVELARQMCAGLGAAHEAGVLHRDLKPANVMIDGRGKARITDFGLAVVSEEMRGEEVRVGTPAYMSPEQLKGQEVTQRSDIYSLGLVLYELFTGKRVYEAKSLQELMELHERSSPETPSSHVKGIDPLVERVILRCLEKEPKARPATAVQVALALPGGDPLQAALAMGETPSPEMVAAAGEKTGLRPKVAVAFLAAIIVLLGVYMWLNGKVILISRVPMEIPPEVLAHKARELAAQFGYAEKPTDTAYGFATDNDFLAYANASERRGEPSLVSRERLATGRQPAYEYWYRESPLHLINLNVIGFGVALDSPPMDVSGMVGMRLDPLGRLRYFAAVLPRVESRSEPSGSAASPFAWAAIFAAAGLDQSSFTAAEPQWTPLASWDERAAWTGTYPEQTDLPIRLEAAAYRGRLVYFQIIEPWTPALRKPAAQQTLGLGWGIWITLWVFIIAVFGIGWKNYRQGKGDRRGAFRLALFAACVYFLALILSSDHAPIVNENANLLVIWALALAAGLTFWSAYMALEPLIRRRSPETIITWSRLLMGQIRDPLLGRDILIGVLASCAYMIVLDLVLWASALDRIPPIHASLLGTRHVLGIVMNRLYESVLSPAILLMLFFLFRVVLRKPWLAAAAVILIFTFIFAGPPSIVNVLLWGLSWSVIMFLLLRFGLVAACALWFCNGLLFLFPITANLTAWYASIGMFAVGVALLLAGFAFYTSLGGQKVIAGELLED
jgi:serine/threonine-protein kinase